MWVPHLLLCMLLGMLILHAGVPAALAVAVCLSLLALMLVWPEIITLSIMFVVYANLPVLAMRFHGVSQWVAGAMILLLAMPMAHYLLINREPLIIDLPFVLMLVFLVVLLAASFVAKDWHIAFDWIITYIHEGIVPYVLILNVVRNVVTLKRIIWVLCLTGGLLGALGLYQELTHSYAHQFGGLAQRQLGPAMPGTSGAAHGPRPPTAQVQRRSDKRAQGPIGEANRYAQIMLVLIPLALFRFWEARSRLARIGGAAATILILSGVLLSYSRGGFLTLLVIFVMLMLMRYIRPQQMLVSVVVCIFLVALVAPGYFARLHTIRGVEGLFSYETVEKPDGAIRGRLTEMLSTLLVFWDYPLLGVGPGQYMPFYSEAYQLNPDIAFRHIPRARRGHTLYFELAAETGVVGLTVFMSIVLCLLARLWRARRRRYTRGPDLANLATGFWLSIVAYLCAGLFLHLAYQRYLWLLLALAGATVQILRADLPPRPSRPRAALRPLQTLPQAT